MKYIVLFLLVVLTTNGLAVEKTITLTAQEFSNDDLGDLLLFHEDIVTEAFNKVGYKVTFEHMPWARVMRKMEAGMYDAAYTAVYNEERAKRFAFSNPYMKDSVILYRKKSRDIHYDGNLKALKPYTIGVVRDWSITPEFDSADYLKNLL